MKRLQQQSDSLLCKATSSFRRSLFYTLVQPEKMTGIIGPRGVGKTNLMIQIARRENSSTDKVLYLSLDDPAFSVRSLVDYTGEFVRYGGELLLLDELHRYPNALQDLTSIQSDYPDLKIIFACSSAGNEEGLIYELSRLADLHYLPALSFREFLQLKYGLSFPIIQFDELLDYNLIPGAEVIHRIRPLGYFEEYLKSGFHPYEYGSSPEYYHRLRENLLRTVSEDIMAVYKMDYESLSKVNRILMYLAERGGERPNVERMADWAGTTRDSLLKFLKYLHKAGLIAWVTSGNGDINYLNKPARLFLGHPNLMFATAGKDPDRAIVLESFLHHQLRLEHQVNLISGGRYLVDLEFEFIMGWTGKPLGSYDKNQYELVDGLEKKIGARVPLWMMGFLY